MSDLMKDVLSVMVIPVLIVVISPFINYIVTNEGNKRKLGKEWRCKCKKSSVSNYIILLITCLLFLVVAPLFGGGLLSLCIPNVEVDILIKVGGLCIYIILIVISNVLCVKKRLFVSKKNSRLLEGIFTNLVLANGLGAFIFMFIVPYLKRYIAVLYLFFIVLEIIAFYIFEDKQYFQFNKAEIILDDNKKIKGVDSSSIYVKGKWFIASYVERGKEKEIRVLQDKVQKIIYYEKQY